MPKKEEMQERERRDAKERKTKYKIKNKEMQEKERRNVKERKQK